MKFLGIYGFMLLIICFFNATITIAQETPKRFQFEFGYGVSFSGDTEKNDFQRFENFEFSTPLTGRNIEVVVKYVFKNKRFVGLGFTQQSYVNTLNGRAEFNNQTLIFENYRLDEQLQYLELQYGKFFDNGLDFTISLLKAFYYQPLFDQGGGGFELSNTETRADDLGLAAALGFKIYSRNSFDFSIRTKIYYTLSGLEAITLSPLMRFNF